VAMTKEDRPAPGRSYCCGHATSCAVHRPPYAIYAGCSCGKLRGRPAHPRRTPDPRLVRGPTSIQ
jgi:hypothetical protein